MWWLGCKDLVFVEFGKVMWYVDSEYKMFIMFDKVGRLIWMVFLVFGFVDFDNFLFECVENELMFICEIVVLLWEGYNIEWVCVIYVCFEWERVKYESFWLWVCWIV